MDKIETADRPFQYSLSPGMLVFRGLISIVFGVWIYMMPGPSLVALALLFGIYAFADGVLSIAAGIKRGRNHETWGAPVFEGILGILAGILTFMWPGMTLMVLAVLVGVWALSTGVIELYASFSLHKFLPRVSRGGRFFLGLAGVISIALGIGIFSMPALGLVTLLTLVASYSIVFGILLLGLASNIRKEERISKEIPYRQAA